MLWEQNGGWVDSLAVWQPMWTSKCCRGPHPLRRPSPRTPVQNRAGKGASALVSPGVWTAWRKRCIIRGLAVVSLCLFLAAVAATVTACRASCPDQTHTLATEVSCGGIRGPCGTSPDGSPRYCDYQIGADAGGYCVDCLWKTSASSSLAQKDATERCTLNSCPEPCGEGSLRRSARSRALQ